jgi:spermidine synthase
MVSLRRSLSFGFLLMGFSFAVTQALLIREFLVSFYGNELSIGLILGTWLLLEALGSGLLGRIADPWMERPSSFPALQILFAVFLPLCLLAIGVSRSAVGALPGQGVGLVPIVWSSCLILAPLGLVDGAMFACGSRSYMRLIGEPAVAIGRVYIVEALGGIVGGIVFTYLFIPFLEPLQMALVLSALNLLAAIVILTAHTGHNGRRFSYERGFAAVLLITDLVVLLSPFAKETQHWAASQSWTGYHLLYSDNSAYGNVAVVERAGQRTFLSDGIPILSAPVPDVALSEEFVHLPLLFVPNPQRALVLSGGLGGVLRELVKYPLERIDYAELDPLLINAVQKYPTSLTTSELGDPRLRLESIDGRLLVRELQTTGAMYDLVIVNLPYPSTLQLNRFYTVEFYEMVRDLLAEDGVVVTAVPASLSYMSDELRRLNVMVDSTLRAAFPNVRPIPGDVALWLASASPHLSTATTDWLAEKWRARSLDAQLVTEPHIRLRFDQRYLDWFLAALGAQGAEEQLNRDLHPLGLFRGLSYWNALFTPALVPVFAAVGQIRLWQLGIFIMASSLCLWALIKIRGRASGLIFPVAVGATGFVGMATDLVIVLSFQSLYGLVYHWIGLLLTAFMAGVAAGGWLSNRSVSGKRRDTRTFIGLEAAIVLFWALMPLVLHGLQAAIDQLGVLGLSQAGLFALNAVAGFFVGAQFPVANRLWLTGRGTARGAAGALYASDLVGAFLGSILVSVLLVPVLGVVATCVLAVLLKLCTLLLCVSLAPRF